MSSAFEKLPTELLDLIMVQFGDITNDMEPGYERLRPLKAVSESSTTLRLAAEPHLYRVFSNAVSYNDEQKDEQQKDEQGGAMTRQFLRTLCEKPRRALHIQYLRIIPTNRVAPLPDAKYSNALKSTLIEVRYGQTHDKFKVFEALHQGCHNAEAILIVALAKKVRQLYLRLSNPAPRYSFIPEKQGCGHCPNMGDFLYSLLVSPRVGEVFPCLTDVDIDTQSRNDAVGTVSYKLAEQLLRIPKLSELRIENPQPWNDDGITLMRELGVSSLTIDEYSEPGRSLYSMSEACKALKKLRVEWVDSTDVDFASLRAVLQKHMKSLQDLHLEAIMAVPSAAVCHLDGLGSLKRLTIDATLLACGMVDDSQPIPRLPCSLTHLTVLGSCLANLSFMLPKVAPQLQTGLAEFVITLFDPWAADGSAVLDLIKYEDTSGGQCMAQFKDNADWIIAFGPRPDENMTFQCRNSERKTIQQTVNDLIAELSKHGHEAVLTSYYSDWPPYDPVAALAVDGFLKELRLQAEAA